MSWLRVSPALAVALCALVAHALPPQLLQPSLLQPALSRDAHLFQLQAAKVDPKSSFRAWVDRFERAYKEDVQEFERRFSIWLDNLEFIIQYNANHTSHWLGLNHLADWTHEEYREHALGYRPDLRQGLTQTSTGFMYADTNPAENVDWREQGAVTPVKNQMQCGSCWAFSTTGSIEGINAIVTKDLVSLSEQELLDCDTSRDHGCQGGLMDFAFTFILQNGGIDTEEDYKYEAMQDQCNFKKERKHVVVIDGYEDVPPNDEVALKKAVFNQPVSVAIEADQREFQLYQGGVFDAPCGTALDHGVLVVGYGTEAKADGSGPVDYWLVKNSWGGFWGDQGYIKLVRGIDNAGGQCGIAMQASYPVKKGPNPPPAPTPPPGPTPPPTPPTPPPPTPEPVDCDGQTQCPNGSTCCCMREYFGFCFTWACCPLVEATCCDDHLHCCPSTLPVCDVAAGRCLAGTGQGFEGSEPWIEKQPAHKTTSGRFPLWPFSRAAELVSDAAGQAARAVMPQAEQAAAAVLEAAAQTS